MHTKKKWTWILVISLSLALAFVGQSLAADKVKVALFVILSGSGADLGEQSRNGAELALEDINNSGGIKALGGAELELVVADVTTTYSKGPNITERVLSTNDVAGAIGYGYSGMTLACLPVIEKAKIPLVTTSISNKITAQGYKYVFEICPKGTQFGETQVRFAAWLRDAKKLDVKKVGFVFENGPYGTSTAEGLKKGAQEVGFDNVVLYQPYDKDITDAGPLVTKIKASGADVVFATSYTPDAQLLVSTMKAMRVTPVLIGGGAGFCWPPIQESIGEKVNGIFSVGSWSWDTKNIVQVPERLDVTKRYEQRFGTFMPEQAGEHYAAVWLLKEAMERAGSAEPEKVRAVLAKEEFGQSMEGMMQPGVIGFDETGWNHYTFPTMIQWQDQKPTTVYPESVATSKVVWPIQ
jgi:branched-chain amino acid transport system substrate-binding protein